MQQKVWFGEAPFDPKWNPPYVSITHCTKDVQQLAGGITRIILTEPVPYDLYTGDVITVQRHDFISEVGVESIKVCNVASAGGAKGVVPTRLSKARYLLQSIEPLPLTVSHSLHKFHHYPRQSNLK